MGHLVYWGPQKSVCLSQVEIPSARRVGQADGDPGPWSPVANVPTSGNIGPSMSPSLGDKPPSGSQGLDRPQVWGLSRPKGQCGFWNPRPPGDGDSTIHPIFFVLIFILYWALAD